MDLDAIRAELPAHVHITTIGGVDVVTGEDLSYPLLWADRSYRTCPRCGQDVGLDLSNDPPACLNTSAGQGGQPQSYSQQHQCGDWLAVDWLCFEDGDTSDEAILEAARKMAADRDAEIAAAVQKLREQVQRDLDEAAARVREPLEDGETLADRLDSILTGSETEPGVYVQTVYFDTDDLNGAQLVAWAAHPVAEDADPIEATTPLADLIADRGHADTGTPLDGPSR